MLFSFVRVKRIRSPKLNWVQAFSIALLLNLLVLGGLIAFNGAGNFSLNFRDVYSYRVVSKESLPGIFGYLRPVATKVMLPIAMILALKMRNLTLVIFTILICIAFFAYSHHKSILLASVTAIFLYFGLQRARSSKVIGAMAVALLLITISTMLWSTFIEQQNSPAWIASLVVRRAIFVPVLLDGFYIDFFSENPFFFWSQSSLGLGLMEMPFDRTAPFLIGLEFFGSEAMSANAGYIGAGFSNAGILGVAIYGIIIGFIIAFLNEYGNNVGHPLLIAVGFSLFMAILRSADLPTAFVTHGLLFLLLFVVFFPGTLLHKSADGRSAPFP
jgi:hypothetical protein